MKHEQPDHFVEQDIDATLRNAREDQIKRLLRDIGFLPRPARKPGQVDGSNVET